jgi:carbon monoxide dehydrogenase subunit G
MKLEESFEVAAPLERVWAALIDVEQVVPCLPGAAVTGRNDDGSYGGTFKVKIGPTSAAYSGKLIMEAVDEEAHTATMNASGTDKRGQGGAKAMIMSSVSEAGEGLTRVEVVTDYHITGRLARFGRGGMIEEISNKLLGQFAQCLQESLGRESATPAAAEPEGPEVVAGPEVAAAPEAQPPPPPPPPRPPVESEPVQGLTLVGSALWSQAKQNPASFVALVLGLLLALRVLRRRG